MKRKLNEGTTKWQAKLSERKELKRVCWLKVTKESTRKNKLRVDRASISFVLFILYGNKGLNSHHH